MQEPRYVVASNRFTFNNKVQSICENYHVTNFCWNFNRAGKFVAFFLVDGPSQR